MKTNKSFSKFMVAMMTVVVSLFATSANAQTCQYYTSAGDSVQYKYEYALDRQGRVVEKTRLRWDDTKAVWVPLTKYTAHYGRKSHSLDFAVWTSSANTFVVKDRKSYSADSYPALLFLPRLFSMK